MATLNFTLNQVIKNTSFKTDSSGNFTSNEPIPVRTLGVILDESDPFFEQNGIPDSAKPTYFGIIKFQDYNNPIYNIDGNNNLSLLARPINPNIKHYPLKNEIVYLLLLPNWDSKNNTNTYSFYYYPPINMENNISSNPIIPSYNSQNTPQLTKEEVIAGAVSNPSVENPPTPMALGKKFPLNLSKTLSKTFEGDIMYEGRFGNSLRFSSDLYGGEDGKGQPLTILANQAGDNLTEDINKDNASVYLTTNQKIKINVANKNLGSFKTKLKEVNTPLLESEETQNQIPTPLPTRTEQQQPPLEIAKTNEKEGLEELGIYKDNDNNDTLIYKIKNLDGSVAAIGSNIADAFIKMRKAALIEGATLNINSGFRPGFGNGIPGIASSQPELRKRNLKPEWVGRVDPNSPDLKPLGKYFSPITAAPGTSKHGDSNAIDIQVNGGNSREYRWLVKNASKFGFVRDVQSETWHWIYKPNADTFAFIPPSDPSWKGLT